MPNWAVVALHILVILFIDSKKTHGRPIVTFVHTGQNKKASGLIVTLKITYFLYNHIMLLHLYNHIMLLHVVDLLESTSKRNVIAVTHK